MKTRTFDRLTHFDPKSRAWPIRTRTAGKLPRSYTWRCSKCLDQGTEGACVGFGVTHELIARPVELASLSARMARNIYFEAQHLDPWPGGAYPGATPFYEGTSVLSGMKAAQARGYYDSYRWGFDLDDLILGLGYTGPAVLGLAWHEDMSKPDAHGFIRPTGPVLGGHCILANGVNVKNETIRLHNSWGESWGVKGECLISWTDMARLLDEEGEVVFPLKRSHGK